MKFGGYSEIHMTGMIHLCCFQTGLPLAQALLAAEGWPSEKQRLANKSITLPLCPPGQIAYSWLQFISGVKPLGDTPKRLLKTMKQQAVITGWSGKLVWIQHYSLYNFKLAVTLVWSRGRCACISGHFFCTCAYTLWGMRFLHMFW